MLPILTVLILLFALSSHAATHSCADPSYASVSGTNALAAVVDGDTIVIPSGTALWTNSLVISKAITLQGAGVGQTIIQDGIAAYGTYFLNITLVSNKTTRITGITFTNGAGSYSGPGLQNNRIRISGTSIDDRRIRFDNCKIDSLNGPAFVFYTALGVVDHNIILGAAAGTPAFLGHVINSSWGYAVDTTAWGDGAYTNADNFGTEKFLFFEDNNITNLYVTSALTMLDGHSGARYVFRHNNIHKGSMEIHGAEASRTRSGRAYEIYGNHFESDDSRSSPIYMRGGVGLVYSNTFSGWTANAVFSLLDRRLTDHLFAPIGGADGINPWDVNHAGNPHDTATATSAGDLTVTDSSKSWTNNFWSGFTIRRTSGKAVTSLTRSGTTATVSCTGHGFSTGNYVSIWGANQQPFNSLYIITVTDVNTFTFTINFPPAETTATGTIKCALGSSFALINSNTGTQITFADSIYGASVRMVLTTGDTFEINKVTQSMDQIGVIGGTDLEGTDVPIIWSNTQTVSPWYEWNNTREGGADIDFDNTGSGATYSTIIIGTHAINDTAKPGYSGYIYPHPLVSSAELPPGRRKPHVSKKDSAIIPGSPWFPMWASEDLSDFAFQLSSK